jgi:ComF family protein
MQGRIISRVVDFLLPPRCLSCHEPVESQGVVCQACWADIDFISDPFCESCGLPFEYDYDEAMQCVACVTSPPHFSVARAAVVYKGTGKKLILSFKHGDATHAAPLIAKWMQRAGRSLIENTDLIIPVPLHWSRLIKRRYNQAALLAHALSKETGVATDPLILKRIKATKSQGLFRKGERLANVKGAFTVDEKRTALKNKRILLIDDVFTTGATVNACAKTLLKAKAADVKVLAFAYVIPFIKNK